MRKSTTAAVTAALALMSAPALAQKPEDRTPRGQSTSPAKICSGVEGLSKKKVRGTKGQSSWAGCVSGVRRANRDARDGELQRPAALCRAVEPALSRKKARGEDKSPWAGCVSGAAKAQRKLQTATTA